MTSPSYDRLLHPTPVTTAGLAGGSLLVGFAVAEITGVRALGGLVLVAAVATCAVAWRRLAGGAATVALVVGYLALFVASHLLARVTGAWPAVLLVSVVMAVASLRATTREPVVHR